MRVLESNKAAWGRGAAKLEANRGARIMKTYLITTAALFGLITIAHLWRILGGEAHLAKDPWYILITLATVALCLWAVQLLRRLR
jgi:hypothetical protein